MKYLAWYKGKLLSDIILTNIISAAERGLMTEAGKQLILVPDRRYGSADAFGLRLMKRVKKSECVSLEKKYRRFAKS